MHRRYLIQQQLASPFAASSSSDIGNAIDKIRTAPRAHFQDDPVTERIEQPIHRKKGGGEIFTPLFHGAAAIPTLHDIEEIASTDADILCEMIERALAALHPSHPSHGAEGEHDKSFIKKRPGARHKSDVFLFVKKKGEFQVSHCMDTAGIIPHDHASVYM